MTGTGENTANWLRGQDLNLRSPAYETGEDDRAPLPRHKEKARRGLKVRDLGGSWHGDQSGSRAWDMSAGADQGEKAPAERLPLPGRRRGKRQTTAVREDLGQPVGDLEEGGASLGSLRRALKEVTVVPGNTPCMSRQTDGSKISKRRSRSTFPPGDRGLRNPHDRSELRLRHTKDSGPDMFNCFHGGRILCAIGFLATPNYPFAHFSLSACGYTVPA